MGRLPETALAFQTTGQITHEVATGPAQEHTPEHTIKFAVIGLDHSQINGITDTIRRRWRAATPWRGSFSGNTAARQRCFHRSRPRSRTG